MTKSVDEMLAVIKEGTVQVSPAEDLKSKLQKKKKLRVKLGMDPTAPDLHLGHTIVLRKLRQFQEFGHTVIFLIGDFTARIGDPSGRSKMRPPLSMAQIKQNADTYFKQVGYVLDTSKIEIRYNAAWLSHLSLEDMVRLAGKVTLARIIERDDFQTRLKEHVSIGFHELFYPLLQGYDSVELAADVEIGGTDQTFNLLMGRFLQEQYQQEPQVILTMPLLEGLDGVQKMSKSYGNYIGLTEEPNEVYGKLMSISDELMWRYRFLLLHESKEEIKRLQVGVADNTYHPMDLKKEMAYKIVEEFWSEKEARKAQEQFKSLFQQHDYSKAKKMMLPADTPNPIWIVDLLKHVAAITSSSEAKRLIEGGAVLIDEKPVADFKAQITWKSGMVIKVGKHRIYQLT